MLACQVCGAREFLYQGRCKACAPDAHRDYEQRRAKYEAARLDYLHETGKEPVSDWEAFVEWCEHHD
jgi:hypothetical protein